MNNANHVRIHVLRFRLDAQEGLEEVRLKGGTSDMLPLDMSRVPCVGEYIVPEPEKDEGVLYRVFSVVHYPLGGNTAAEVCVVEDNENNPELKYPPRDWR